MDIAMGTRTYVVESTGVTLSDQQFARLKRALNEAVERRPKGLYDLQQYAVGYAGKPGSDFGAVHSDILIRPGRFGSLLM
jgi:hypothetical protein